MKTDTFVENISKGKIAEGIFEMMFRQVGYYVTHFGYEYTSSEFIRSDFHLDGNKTFLDQIKTNPDFIVETSGKLLYFVEVKFQRIYSDNFILKMVEKTLKRWDGAWYFVATPEKFYFDECKTIVQNKGIARALSEKVIHRHIQDEYLALLNKFIPPHEAEIK